MKYIITLLLIILKNSFQSKTSFLKQIPLRNKNEIIDITWNNRYSWKLFSKE